MIEKWKPDWDAPVDRVASKAGVMGQDSLDSARVVLRLPGRPFRLQLRGGLKQVPSERPVAA